MTSLNPPAAGFPAELERPNGRGSAIGDLVRSATHDAAWVRIAHLGVMALAAVLYVFNLTVSGFANTYYSAAALAASQSWSAWFFGSFDSAGFITVDKPPLATMLVGLSVRIFGLSSWSVLLPEALLGVATVGLLFAVVRRSFGPVAGLIAALVMALTPAAVLMFRYNNPDALLTFLLVAAAWSFIRGIESGRIRWIIAAALFVGLGFNTKYLQAWLVLLAFALTWATAAPVSVRRRLVGLIAAGLTVLVSSGLWVLAVELIPASMRPYIGGSTNNSALELLLGYDGLARIFGNFGATGGLGGGGFGGNAGLLRLFNTDFGGQVSWLIPFSLIGLVGGLALRSRAARTDTKRAAYLMWGLWLVMTGVVFSLMSGIIHSYYAVALAPAIGALVGAGAVDLWALRARFRFGSVALAGAIVVSAGWAFALLDRSASFAPGLGIAIAAIGIAIAIVIALPPDLRRPQLQLAAAALGIVVLLAGPAAYAVNTMTTGYSGGDPKAGPAVASSFGGPGGNAFGGPLGGGFASGTAPGGGGGNDGVDSALTTYLVANKGSATWVVATTSAQNAGTIQLATGQPVMAMGGFSGTDPAPTLAEFQALVRSGQVRFVLLGGGGFGPGGVSGSNSTTSEINAWVQSVGSVVDYGGSGATLYDLAGV